MKKRRRNISQNEANARSCLMNKINCQLRVINKVLENGVNTLKGTNLEAAKSNILYLARTANGLSYHILVRDSNSVLLKGKHQHELETTLHEIKQNVLMK